MTLKELDFKVRYVGFGRSHGQYEIRILYRGKEYRCFSNNSRAFDRIHSRDSYPSDSYVDADYTYKQALQAFWDECKRKNGLK